MADSHIPEIEQLQRLLRMEKEADFELHRQKVQSLPLDQRIGEGYTWYPVMVAKSGYTIGERAFVIVERSGSGEPHQFRSGATVSFFTRQPAVRQPAFGGVIQFVDRNRMKIVLNTRDLPDWIGLGQAGVDLQFDERTYLEMEKALDQVLKAGNGRLVDLRSVILGKSPARFAPVAEIGELPSLNPSQIEAVRQILSARDLSVIHGPPGTGKTTTLVQAVRLLTHREQTILVTAPSNTAVDLLTERLAEEGLQVVRIGNLSRVDESILRHTLEVRLSTHPESKHIKKVKMEAAELRRKARRYRRRFGREELDERRRWHQEARELSAWANQLEDRLIDQILDSAQVITCTLVGAAHKVLEGRHFPTVVIDEAAQALEPACWIPICKASRVILTGDPYQLPPTVKSTEAQRGGLAVTMIEKCLQRIPHTRLLNVQYRMHETIMGFSNQRFYAGALRADASVANHRLPLPDHLPVFFIDTAGCGFEEMVRPPHQSRYNPGEFSILREHMYEMLGILDGHPLPSIALISPYREQVTYMEKEAASDPILKPLSLSIRTIDGFQGQERDVVYISLVRSNEKAEIGFLRDYRRMNVAMTRARKQLVVIGDSATIGADPFYLAFLSYCEQHGTYRTAWEYLR